MTTERPVTVLVVDDNPATRYATSRVLRSVGLDVLEASTGREALALALEGPSLIVLDIHLPDLDGFEVCRELRARPETRRTPVIYLSATFVGDLDKVNAVDAGADGYLTHPVEPPVLVATVNAFLRARRAEDALHESEARFKALFDNALNGIALLSQELILLDVNPTMCRILGRPREAIVGRHLSAFSPMESALASPVVMSALASESAWRGTAPVLNAEGRHIDLEWSVSVYSMPDIRLAIVNDVTERRAIEIEREQLLASERQARADAEQANRLKDDFLAALSHELRTPLNAIMGFARVLQGQPLARDPDALESINAIERNARVQAQLVSDLLDISRIASGKLQLDRQWFDPADAGRQALASSQSAASSRNITIDVDLEPGIDPIWWDPARFHQVVWNLIDNAVKFSPPGSSVEVRLRQSDDHVELEVQDRGKGIAKDFLPRVFDRFRQEEAGSRRWHGGLGLGLAVVKQIVLAHGGDISVTSEGKDRGACFLVRLPRIPADWDRAGRQDASHAAAVDLRDVRVLVVEDNADARALIRGILADADATVLDVPNVEAALAALSTFSPDLIVSDIAMPEQDGYDLIQKVRAGWTAEMLPAIALTAFARDDDRRRALKAGYQSHFAKPLDVPGFLAEVRRLRDASERVRG